MGGGRRAGPRGRSVSERGGGSRRRAHQRLRTRVQESGPRWAGPGGRGREASAQARCGEKSLDIIRRLLFFLTHFA